MGKNKNKSNEFSSPPLESLPEVQERARGVQTHLGWPGCDPAHHDYLHSLFCKINFQSVRSDRSPMRQVSFMATTTLFIPPEFWEIPDSWNPVFW